MLGEVNTRQARIPAFLPNIYQLVTVCYFVITLATFSKGDSTFELRKKLLSHYNKSVLPGIEDTPPDVGFYLSVIRIVQFEESMSRMTMQAWVYVNWYDYRLSWDLNGTYGDIKWISVNVDDIWKPNTNVFNGGRFQLYKSSQIDVPAFIVRDGRVWWTLRGDFHSPCVQEDLRWYPLDIHDCRISLGALYPQDMFTMTLINENHTSLHGVRHDHETVNSQWELLQVEHWQNLTSVALVMVYPTDDFTFKVRRQGWTILTSFVPLMLFFMFLSWSSFALPASEKLLSKRLTVSTTCLFLSSVFLLVLIKTVPGVGNGTPVIVKLYTSIVSLEFFTCVHNVVLATIFKKSPTHLAALQKLPEQVQCILGLRKPESRGGGKGLLENEESFQDVVLEDLQTETRAEDTSNLVGIAYDRIHLFLQVVIVILVVVFLYGA